MTETKLKPCPFCGNKEIIDDEDDGITCPNCGVYIDRLSVEDDVCLADVWNTRQVEDDKVKYEPTSYSCRACKNATDSEIQRLREDLKKYEDALFEICFCCAAVDCSLDQQSEALKAIDIICKEFYLSPENGIAKPLGERND